MPAQPSWLVRIPAILECLRDPATAPFLDRPAVERLFGVRRRQAIRLMGGCRGYQVGRTFLVDRQAVIEFLEEAERSGSGEQARARKQRVMAFINEGANQAAARQVQIPRPAGPSHSGLPAGISLSGAGRIEITYGSAEELLSRVAELVTAATRDFGSFREVIAGKG